MFNDYEESDIAYVEPFSPKYTNPSIIIRLWTAVFVLLNLVQFIFYTLDAPNYTNKDNLFGYIMWGVLLVLCSLFAVVYMFTTNYLVSILYSLSIVTFIIVEIIIEAINYIKYSFEILNDKNDMEIIIFALFLIASVVIFILYLFFIALRSMFSKCNGIILVNVFGLICIFILLTMTIIRIVLKNDDKLNNLNLYFDYFEIIPYSILQITFILSIIFSANGQKEK